MLKIFQRLFSLGARSSPYRLVESKETLTSTMPRDPKARRDPAVNSISLSIYLFCSASIFETCSVPLKMHLDTENQSNQQIIVLIATPYGSRVVKIKSQSQLRTIVKSCTLNNFAVIALQNAAKHKNKQAKNLALLYLEI